MAHLAADTSGEAASAAVTQLPQHLIPLQRARSGLIAFFQFELDQLSAKMVDLIT